MVGVDYSESSVQLARKLALQHDSSLSAGILSARGVEPSIRFDVFDVMKDEAKATDWWLSDTNGFDLVLDKGTFDAISLSSETYEGADGSVKRIHEAYPEKVAKLIRPGGLLLITSCNWTQNEIEDWFTKGVMLDVLEVFHIIRYPSFEFGGQKGQGVVSICFQKAGDRSRELPVSPT
jgi:EEF1A lysine methyltransferase 2